MAELRTITRPHNWGGSSVCDLCGEQYHERCAGVSLDSSDIMDPAGTLCPICVQAGPAGAAERIRNRAGFLQKRVEWLLSMAGKVERITEWATLEDLHQAELEAHRLFLEDEREHGAKDSGIPF